MRRFILLLTAVTAGFILNVQSVQALDHLVAFHQYIDDQGNVMESHVSIINTGTDTLRVVVKRTTNSMATGHTSYFCWELCYGPATSLSPDPVVLAPGDTTSKFYGHMTSGGASGVDNETYCFYDRNGLSDSVCLNFVYTFAVGINEPSAKAVVINAFPNPADAYTNVSCSNLGSSKETRLVIYNMLGSAVKEVKMNDRQSSVMIPTGDLKPGVYFYSLVADNRTLSSKRLIITHH